ncbi:MAG TPA: tripartite tricarboxylate transporter substrate binding protein [Burkholderiales bacterium]|jgi:tripartite-type tricarboxylate transporter receptor subunit TctC|nr:tripartite tricarboxylate transporter substrate binding protein [Burkholderiales bacterium]
MRRRISWLSLVALTAVPGVSPDGNAAEPAYPQRAIRLLVPQAAGGGSDTIARFMAQKLGDSLGQQIVVDNRPGAAGMLGAEMVRQATPDGHTLLLCAIDTITAPMVSRRKPFDGVKDFAPVTQLTLSPNIWLVSLSFPAQTMKSLVDMARAKPRQIDFASSGVGSMQHLGGELLNRMAGIELNHVPYKGGPPGLVDVLGGRVPTILSGTQGALPYIKAGKLRALAVTTPKRFAAVPDLPTVAEALNLPGYEATNWQGLLFPLGTPRPIIERVAGETIKILALGETKARLETLGYDPSGPTPAQFTKLMVAEQKRWAEIIKAAGITSD